MVAFGLCSRIYPGSAYVGGVSHGPPCFPADGHAVCHHLGHALDTPPLGPSAPELQHMLWYLEGESPSWLFTEASKTPTDRSLSHSQIQYLLVFQKCSQPSEQIFEFWKGNAGPSTTVGRKKSWETSLHSPPAKPEAHRAVETLLLSPCRGLSCVRWWGLGSPGLCPPLHPGVVVGVGGPAAHGGQVLCEGQRPGAGPQR